jgi:hypothetical protein
MPKTLIKALKYRMNTQAFFASFSVKTPEINTRANSHLYKKLVLVFKNCICIDVDVDRIGLIIEVYSDSKIKKNKVEIHPGMKVRGWPSQIHLYKANNIIDTAHASPIVIP